MNEGPRGCGGGFAQRNVILASAIQRRHNAARSSLSMSLATLEKRSPQSGGFGPPVFHPFYPSQTLRASGRAATLSRSARRLTRTSLLVADAIFQSALSELDPHDRARRI